MKPNAYPQAKTTTKTDLGTWLEGARERLSGLTDQPGTEAQVLAAAVLNKNRTWILAHPEYRIDPPLQDELSLLLSRLVKGEPLPYLTGRQEFYGLDFVVNPRVLIPRPETELLVEHALDWIDAHPGIRRVVDVATGSGCIAVAIAKLRPSVHVLATDRSRDALRVAWSNTQKHRVADRVDLVQADLLTAVRSKFELVTANLPYIPSRDLVNLPVARHEPLSALDGGEDGLSWIRALIVDARRWLGKDGCLLLEVEYRQGRQVVELAQATLPGARVCLYRDFSGLDRLVEIING